MNDMRPVPRSRRSDKHARQQTPSALRPRARYNAPRQAAPAAQTEQPERARPAKKKASGALRLVILILLLALAFEAFRLVSARKELADLRSQREAEEAAYEQLVARHTVNETKPRIEKSALHNGIEPAFVAAVILRESSYDPRATSNVGARGLMQLMPNTFEQVRSALGDSAATFDDMYNPETNIRYGCWYLGYLSRIFDGDPIEMACAYHAGPNNVKLWIMNYAADQQNLQLDEIPMEDTRYYAGKVYDAYAIYYQHFYPDPV